MNHGWNVWLASVAAVAAAALVGAVNGWLIVCLGVNTIVVTLGMATFLLGIALWVSNLTPVSGLSHSFSLIALQDVAGLPLGFWEGLVLMLGFAYVLACTPLGRNMRFVGANREVSRLAGIQVNRIRFGSFVAAGTIAGVGGVLSSAATGGFDPTISQSYLLPIFAATFLGTAVARTRPVQPARHPDRGLLPGHRHPRPAAARRGRLGVRRVLRRRPGHRGDPLHAAAPPRHVGRPDPLGGWASRRR